MSKSAYTCAQGRWQVWRRAQFCWIYSPGCVQVLLLTGTVQCELHVALAPAQEYVAKNHIA